jgi:DNA-3-methyladenine glycosylase I
MPVYINFMKQKPDVLRDFNRKALIDICTNNYMKSKPTPTTRCPWPSNDPLMIEYHDKEWGKEEHDDKKIFEHLVLETMQAGLNWKTILHKRENFRKAFANFDYKKIAKFAEKDVKRLMKDKGIIRNELKIKAIINNSKIFLQIQKEFKSFDKYIWEFVNNKRIVNHPKTLKDLPAKTELSEKISADMKRRGFKFLGPTTIYAHMQATGMVDDHLNDCFRKGK